MATDAGAGIVIDWGTTNVRAYRLDAAGGTGGAVRDRRASAHGIVNMPDRAFRAAFDALIGDWLAAAPGTPVLMAGMIGSRQGWVEAPYAACPITVADLAAAVVAVPELPDVAIVPGVSYRAPGDRYDVMRGEEVQIFGALAGALQRAGDGVLCLPGTHAKWAVAAGGRLERFATAMTGEVYDALAKHTILGTLMADRDARAGGSDAAFARGLERAAEDCGLLHHLFSVRADGLFDVVPAAALADYLSGILIGHEVAAMLAAMRPAGAVRLIGAPALAARYAAALAWHGHAAEVLDSDAVTVAGLAAVAAARPWPARP